MMSYPECTSCDCDCGFATLEDDIDQNSVNEDIESQQANNGVIPIGQANTFLAPVNMPSSYNVKHPNSENNSSEDLNSFQSGPFWAGPCLPETTDFCFNCGIPSLITSAMQQNITGEIAARGILDYARLFSGYDILNSSGTVNVDKIYGDEFSLYHAPQPFFILRHGGNLHLKYHQMIEEIGLFLKQ